jgi:putative Holliday junction resolvase
MSIYLGIDYGKKRIGIAHCDENETFCFGLPTIEHRSSQKKEAVEAVLLYQKQYKAYGVVMGLPVNMDGSIGFMGEAIYDFVEAILKTAPDLKIYLIDERLTSKIAEQRIRASGKSPSMHKGLIDQEAARQILDDFLRMDSLRREALRYE